MLQFDENFKVILFWNVCLLAAALGLRLQKIIIPQYKFRGETAILECDYQLNGKRDSDDDIENTNFNYHDHNGEVEVLYSVKVSTFTLLSDNVFNLFSTLLSGTRMVKSSTDLSRNRIHRRTATKVMIQSFYKIYWKAWLVKVKQQKVVAF